MKIKKILHISGIGRFSNFQQQTSPEWDGSFKQVNVIYAPNGSGKTTLTTILKSLNSLAIAAHLRLKKTFKTTNPQYIKILTEPDGIVELKNESWSNHNLKIEALDILFIEEYLYSGSVLNKQNKLNLFKLLAGDKWHDINNRYTLYKSKLNSANRKLKREIHKNDNEALQKLDSARDKLKEIVKEIEELSSTTFKQYIEISNKYLLKFAPYIKFDKFEFEPLNDNSKKIRLKLIIDIHDEKIAFLNPTLSDRVHTVKYTLSEGDKSAVALCFFLARLEIVGHKDKIIIFDDPLSSFDYGRKITTINTLAKIA